MGVEYVLPEVAKADAKHWQPASDTDQGQSAVKEQTTTYLPAPTCDAAEDKSTSDRYKGYLSRAIFYNVVGRTARGFVGLVYNKEPLLNLPPSMKYLERNVDGTGVGLTQQSASKLKKLLLFGRAGLLVNFPRTGGAVSVRDRTNGRFQPTIHVYKPWNIINYREQFDGSRRFTTLVVLREDYVEQDDGFEQTKKVRYRELRMVPNPDTGKGLVCVVRLWQINEPSTRQYAPTETSYPKDAEGLYLDHIPFYIAGSDENNWDLDVAPLYDIVMLNIGHYRNSADYEDSCHFVGQPTYWASGLKQQWVDKNLKGRMQVGSRTLIPLPENASMGILQPDPNTLAAEAMKHKEDQMTALGAKIVEQRTVARTATETSGDAVVDNSILAVCVRNMNDAYRRALEDVALFLGDAFTEEHYFQVNTDYDTRRMTAQERQQLVEEFTHGAITFAEMRHNFKRSGVATEDVDDARKQIEKEAQLRKLALEAERPQPGPNSSQTSPTPGDKGTGGG